MQRAMSVEDIANKLKPLFGKKVDELYFRYSVANSFEEKNEIYQIFTSLYQKHLSKLLDKQVLLSPPSQESMKGEYPLAKIKYAQKELYDFNLRERDWPRHVCVSGMSGSGKTTFAINVLNNFTKKNKPFLVFDWKSSFRPLMKTDPELMIFTVGNDSVSNLFKVNINRPPKGVHPKEWINTLCDLLTESFSASFGVHKILLETLDEIFNGWGIYDGAKHYPNWQHVKRMLESKSKEAKGRETGWYESAMRIASVMTFGSFGKVVNYDGKRNLSIEELFDKRVILEMNSLSTIEKKFFSEYVLTYIYKLKKANPNEIDSRFKHAIMVDEAHNVFLKKQTNFMSESVTDMIYREMREYGTSLICLDQHVSKLSDTVTGNSACHIAFQQQLPQDIDAISGLMQMRESKESFSNLAVGSAIVKLSERHTEPFLVKAPFMELRKQSVSDEEIKSRINALLVELRIKKDEPEFVEKIKKPMDVPKVKIVSPKEEHNPKSVKQPIESKTPKLTEITSEKPKLEQQESKEKESKKETIEVEEKTYSKTQEILSGFIEKKIKQDYSLIEIRKLLEQGLWENCYTLTDIEKAIDMFFEKQFTNVCDKEQTEEAEKTTPKNSGLSNEEEIFMDYLKENPQHTNTTVTLYKILGLSPRKGNTIKNKLQEKGIIKIEEEKNEKGWKKFIRLK